MRGGRGGRWQRRTEPYREPPHGAVAPSPARGALRVSSPGRPSGHTPAPGLRPGTIPVPPGQAGRGPAARHRRRFREDLRLSTAAPWRSPLRPTPFPRPREGIPPAGGARCAGELETDPPRELGPMPDSAPGRPREGSRARTEASGHHGREPAQRPRPHQARPLSAGSPAGKHRAARRQERQGSGPA